MAYRPSSGEAGDGAGAIKIVRTGTDPTDDVRVTLAALSARAQRLVKEDVDHRVVSSGRSLYEVSRRAVEGTQQQVQRSTAGDMYAPTSQASVELFMAKHLGFDVQEQQRLLQQLHKSQQQMLADIANAEQAGPHLAGAVGADGAASLMRAPGSASVPGGHTVDAIVARLKGEIIAQAQQEVHQRERELLQRQEHAVFRAAWHPYYVSMADDFEMLAMRAADPGKADYAGNAAALAAMRSQQQQQRQAGARDGESAAALATALQGASGLTSLLGSGSPVADEINGKIAAFAPIVSRYPPSQWIAHFSTYVRDRVVSSGDELAALWVTVERILDTMHQQGSAADMLSYVAASRQVMEEKALGRLLTTTLRMDPARVEEVANMPSGRVMDVIARSSGTTNPWVHAFEAMRAGRYDVAAEAAARTGHSAVEAALRRWDAATPQERASLAPALELRELYAEAKRGAGTYAASTLPAGSNALSSPAGAATHLHSPNTSRASGLAAGESDPHRQAVLFLLLAGATGESGEVNKRTLFDLCSRIGDSIEGVLWMRLVCVRTVEETAKEGPVQALSYTQRIVLDDLQDLVTMAHGNIQRIASFLVHALLPSSGLRLLLENDVTYVDGLHLTLCFHQANILRCSARESPVDVAKHIARYCTLVLLGGEERSLQSMRAGASTFDYFHKMGFDEAFAEFCLKDTVAARLFGQRGIVVSAATPRRAGGGGWREEVGQQQLDGILLEGSEALPVELMRSMSHTAELAATRGNTSLALHLLLALGRACLRATSSPGRGGADSRAYATSLAALQRAVRLACPAMAQAFYLPPHTSHAGALFHVCAQLHLATREAGADALTTSTSLDSGRGDGAGGGWALIDMDPVNGTPRLSRADLAAFESLCTMADVFLCAHAANLEQAMRSFFALPFVPHPDRPAGEVERCVAEIHAAAASASAPSAAVLAAAGAIVPLALRAAASLMQVYGQQQQQHRAGSAAAEAAVTSAAALRQAMQLVCEWLRACGSQAGGSSSGGGAGASLYHACAGDVAEFQQQHLW